MPVPQSINDLSVTRDNNSPAGSESIGNSLDEYLRQLAAMLKEAGATIYTASGTDAISFNTTPAFTSYTTGQRFYIKSAGANTGAMTLNINGLGAKNIYRGGTVALAASDIPMAGAIFEVAYDGSAFQLVLSGASLSDGVITATQLATGAVTTVKIADGAVSTAKIADGAVTSAKLAGTIDYGGVTGGSQKVIKARRGTTAQHSTFTGAQGEITVDTDKKTAVVHDGSTAGGFPLQRADQAIANATTAASCSGNAATATLSTQVTQNTQSGNYTLAIADAGKHIYSANSGAQTITVPTNASVAIPVGSTISIINNGTTAITFTTTSTTVYKAGTSAAWASGGTLAVRGLVTWIKVATDTWFVSGSGLS